jgi:predicted acyltransferase
MRKLTDPEIDQISDGPMPQTVSQPITPPARLLSLDAFRGLTVAGMILVNNPGDWGHIYPPLEHAEWNGWTPTDLIFPFFLFIVGVSITFALRAGDNGPAASRKIIKRGLTLFLLGLFLNFFPRFDPTTVRIMGVLQRIGLVYIACSFVFVNTSSRQQNWIISLLLVGYWLAMTVIPVPGVGFANLEPTTNLGAWIDRGILTGPHLWKTAKVWDPEGLFSTIPAIATGLLGVRVGTWLRRTDYTTAEKMAWLFATGVLTTLAGIIWDAFFPINKALWTSSYVLLAGGLAMIFLATCYQMIDVWGANNSRRRAWAMPFVAYGVNAIAVFFLSGLIPRVMNMIKLPQPDGSTLGLKEVLYQAGFVPYFADPRNASLAGALTFVAIWGVILWLMYRAAVIIKV